MKWKKRKYRYFKIDEKFYYSEKNIDFTLEYLDYNHFLLQQFFKANQDNLEYFFEDYKDIYGGRALGYLKSKYSEWSNGNFHLTEVMKKRILDLMPYFLSDEALSKLKLHEFMVAMKRIVKTNEIINKKKSPNNLGSIEDVYDLFIKSLRNINNLTLNVDDYKYLDQQDIKKTISISTYILKNKLLTSYLEINRDFSTFLPFTKFLDPQNYNCSYVSKYFDFEINLKKFEWLSEFLPPLSINLDVDGDNQFKMYSDKYLAYELVDLNKNSLQNIVDSFLNVAELDSCFSKFKSLSKSGNEIKISSSFKGQGGILNLALFHTPLKKLINTLLYLIIQIMIILICVMYLVIYLIPEYYQLLILLSLFGFFALLELINEKIISLILIFKKIKNYGK